MTHCGKLRLCTDHTRSGDQSLHALITVTWRAAQDSKKQETLAFHHHHRVIAHFAAKTHAETRRRIVDEQEHLNALVRHETIELRHVDADGNKSKNIGSASVSLSQMNLRPITMNEGRQKHVWRKLERENETVEELVGQRRRLGLDSGAAGLSAFSLESNCGDKQPTSNRSGSRFGGVGLHRQERGCKRTHFSICETHVRT